MACLTAGEICWAQQAEPALNVSGLLLREARSITGAPPYTAIICIAPICVLAHTTYADGGLDKDTSRSQKEDGTQGVNEDRRKSAGEREDGVSTCGNDRGGSAKVKEERGTETATGKEKMRWKRARRAMNQTISHTTDSLAKPLMGHP